MQAYRVMQDCALLSFFHEEPGNTQDEEQNINRNIHLSHAFRSRKPTTLLEGGQQPPARLSLFLSL